MISMFRLPVLINAVLFQITWFACVIGSAHGLIWPALLSCSILAVYQLQPANRHATDIKLVILSIAMGLVVDTIWVQAGLMHFTDSRPFYWLAPAWIIVLWVGFALTINHSLAFLRANPALPIVLGLIGGPLSYLAGLKLGAVDYLENTVLISVYLAVAWAVSLTILVRASRTPAELA